LFYGGRKLKF